MENKYLNIKQASILLNVTKLTLRNWDKAGKLTAKRHPLNNYRLYLREEIEEILRKIESGQKPIKYSKIEKVKKPDFYKVKVIHMEN